MASKNYVQGVYNPINKQKYTGKTSPIYRSSLELKMFRWLDRCENVRSWASERVVIPYTSPVDNRLHRYFVDIVCEMNRGTEGIKKYLIEIKPDKFTRPPVESAKKKQKTLLYERYTFAVNMAKWEAARQWCEKKGYKFLVITDKHINS
jgi:hypothetical protein